MASKDIKPKRRLGKNHPRRAKLISWSAGLLICVAGVYAAVHYGGIRKVEVPVARVRRADFFSTAHSRGSLKASRSAVLRAPQVPDLRITHLVANGTRVRKGEVVVEFDGATHEQNAISQTLTVNMIDSSLDQLKSSQKMAEGADALTKIQSEYDVERMKLDAGKAAVISAIEGEKARIKVGVSEGSLQQVRASITAHEVGNNADEARVTQRKIKAARDLEQVTGYLGQMMITAPADGVVALLPNFRSRGSYGTAQPPFKEGDNVWAAAPIAEIPDLATLYVELTLEEVERGKAQLGQAVRVRADAIPDREFRGVLEFISPIGALVYRGGSTPEKTFPARVALKDQDPRLQPGMSISADIITEHVPQVLLAPLRSTFEKNGAPAVYVMKGDTFEVRAVQVGKRNEDEIIVHGGLAEGEMVTLEDPAETARRARKKG